MEKVNNIIRINTSLSGKFFNYWLQFLRPFHQLTDREIEIATSFLTHRFELSKVIKDDEILDKVTMGEDTKRKIREECNITLPHFQVVMGKLRKNKFITDNRINPRFIPNLKEENEGKGDFLLLFHFNLGE